MTRAILEVPSHSSHLFSLSNLFLDHLRHIETFITSHKEEGDDSRTYVFSPALPRLTSQLPFHSDFSKAAQKQNV